MLNITSLSLRWALRGELCILPRTSLAISRVLRDRISKHRDGGVISSDRSGANVRVTVVQVQAETKQSGSWGQFLLLEYSYRYWATLASCQPQHGAPVPRFWPLAPQHLPRQAVLLAQLAMGQRLLSGLGGCPHLF